MNKTLKRDVFILSQAWDKDKILSPLEESNLRPFRFYATMPYH